PGTTSRGPPRRNAASGFPGSSRPRRRFAVASPKTAPSDEDPSRFIASIEDPVRRRDSEALVEMMTRASGAQPVIWGTGIVGFGRYHYRYDSGREGDWFKVGFAPRSKKLTIYPLSGMVGYDDLLSRLGAH